MNILTMQTISSTISIHSLVVASPSNVSIYSLVRRCRYLQAASKHETSTVSQTCLLKNNRLSKFGKFDTTKSTTELEMRVCKTLCPQLYACP